MWRLMGLFLIANVFTPTVTHPQSESVLEDQVNATDAITRPKFEQRNVNYVYEGCGETKTCFGMPNNCVDQRNCEAIVTAVIIDGRFEFELKSDVNNAAYVGLAFSTDVIMGNDAGMECIPIGGNILAYSSWVIARPNLGASRVDVPQDIIRLLDGSFIDGTIYCKFERDPVTIIREKEFDLINNKYHLMLALGTNVQAGSVGMHNINRIVSTEPLNFTVVSTLRGASEVLVKIHGAFMLAAWIGAASVGMVLARYFKQTFVGSTMCGVDQWFAWHRALMIATWILTLASFIIIFVELRAWSAVDNPHAILGTITTILCFIQPFMTLFRPGPKHKNRPIFNWAHWSVGNVAYVLGIVTIFFSVTLSRSQLPQWFDWILVAFVGFQALMHFIFSVIADYSDRRSKQLAAKQDISKVDTSQNGQNGQNDQNGQNGQNGQNDIVVERKKDAPYSELRKGFLAVYLIIVTGFMIAMIVIGALAPL